MSFLSFICKNAHKVWYKNLKILHGSQNVIIFDLLTSSQGHQFDPRMKFLYPPQTLFVVGILFLRCPCVRPCVRPSVRPSVTFCFLNILKSHRWIFIKPCKHVHTCKTNTLNKKVRARGQFY